MPRLQKGLKATIAWLEGEVGQDGTIPVADLIKAMLERKEAEGDELELYLLFDPENEDDVALANAANDAGIPVRNLSAAGDYLEFEPEEPETPPVRRPRAHSSRRGAAADEAETRWDWPPIASPLPSGHAAKAAGVTPGAPLNLTVTMTLPLEQGFIDALAHAIVAQMANVGAQQVEAQARPLASVTSIDGDKPAEPSGRTEQAPGTSAFYYNAAKAEYRKARGMARDGETKIYLTEDEQKLARQNKMLA